MLQFFRDKLHRILILSIVGILVLVFILSAASYLINFSSKNTTLVTVNGDNIDINLVNQHYQRELQTNYAKLSSVDFDSKRLKQNILNDLISQVATIKGLQQNGFFITDEHLIDFIQKDPKFKEKIAKDDNKSDDQKVTSKEKNQTTKKIDKEKVTGKFLKSEYLKFLQKFQISDKDYQNFVRQNLLLNQFRSSILLSNFIIPKDLEQFIYKWFQIRNFRYLIIPKSKFIKPVNKEEVVEYYTNNKEKMLLPERVKIAYIDVSANKLFKQINVNKNELYNYYKQHSEYYTLPELVNVRHILIPLTSNKDEIKQQAEAINILNRIKVGENFQELAKKYSKDSGSADKGGDLGWVGKGEIDSNFDIAVFNLQKPGDITEVFKSKFGFHIAQLIEKRPEKLSEFEQVIEKVTQHYKEDQIQPKINGIYEKLLEVSNNNVDLDKVSKELNLPLNTSELFSQKDKITGIGDNKILMSSVFNQKKINVNSEVIKLGEDHFIIFRVIEKQAPREKSLKEAYEDLEIKNILENKHAINAMNKYANEVIAKLEKNKMSLGKLAKFDGLEWKVINNVNRNTRSVVDEEIINIAFNLNATTIPKLFNLSNGDCLILQILQIKDADLNKLTKQHPDLKNNIQEQLLQLRSYIEQKLYEKNLYEKAKIKFTKSIEQL